MKGSEKGKRVAKRKRVAEPTVVYSKHNRHCAVGAPATRNETKAVEIVEEIRSMPLDDIVHFPMDALLWNELKQTFSTCDQTNENFAVRQSTVAEQAIIPEIITPDYLEAFFFTGTGRNYNMKNKGFGFRWTEVNDISQLSALFGNEHFTPQDRLKTIKEELSPSIVKMIKKVAFCYLRVMLIHFYY